MQCRFILLILDICIEPHFQRILENLNSLNINCVLNYEVQQWLLDPIVIQLEILDQTWKSL